MRFFKMHRVMILFGLFLILAGCDDGGDWNGGYRNLNGFVSASRSSTTDAYRLKFYLPGHWTIYSGPTTEMIDYSAPVATSAGEDVIVDPPYPNARLFFDARMGEGQALFSENHIPLAKAHNLRDMGGYLGADGKYIIFGRLYRSDNLSQLNDDDILYLDSMALANVVDLRSKIEYEKSQDKLPDGLLPVHHPLPSPSGFDFLDLQDKVIKGEADAYTGMLAYFSAHIEDPQIEAWKKIFNVIETGAPVLFHCSSGENRTGMTAALLLLALGVDLYTVIEDFTLTEYYLADYIEAIVDQIDQDYPHPPYPPGAGERCRPLFQALPDYIEAFILTVQNQFGSVDYFLRHAINVDVALLREKYLE